jgi:DNA mismatch endonuclease (patch repair protein)
MLANRKRDTSPEVALRSALHARGARFRKHHRVGAGRHAIVVDVAFPRKRVAVFIDGCFWHVCPDHGSAPKANEWYWTAKLARNKARDELVNTTLRALGWTVVRVWEHEDPETVAETIQNGLGRD